MLIPHGTLIALVDGKRLELYRNTGMENHPQLEQLPAPALDEHNHSAGKRDDSNRGNPSGHHHLESAHASAVAGWFNSQVLAHKIERLVVIADPLTLGELRKHYHKLTEQALHGELHKDLVGRPWSEIVAALRAKD